MLSSLQVLDVRCNDLEALPASVGNLSHLRVLDVRINDIQSVPATLGRLYSLRELNLNNNRLNSIPSSVSSLTLSSLKLAANRLESIPRGLLCMADLVEIQLYGNNLVSQLPSISPNALNANFQGRCAVEKFQQMAMKALFGTNS